MVDVPPSMATAGANAARLIMVAPCVAETGDGHPGESAPGRPLARPLRVVPLSPVPSDQGTRSPSCRRPTRSEPPAGRCFASNAREPAFVLGPDRRVLGVNRAMEDLTGHPADQIVGLVCQPHGFQSPGRRPRRARRELLPAARGDLAGRPAGAMTLFIHAAGERRHGARVRILAVPRRRRARCSASSKAMVRPERPSSTPRTPSRQRLRSELLEVRARLERRHGIRLADRPRPGTPAISSNQVRAASASRARRP